MKKVIMFAGHQHEIPPTKGAAIQTWIDEVSKKIIKYQTHIISIDHPFLPNKEFKDGVYYHRIHIGKIYTRIRKIFGWDFYSYHKRVFNIVKEINPDIVHIHNDYFSKKTIKWIKKFNPNIKIILHMHNESENFSKKDFPKINLFVGCSNYITDFYKNNLTIKANDYKTIHNGVNIESFIKTTEKKELINSSIKKDKNEISICYFGRISPEKGVDKFVELAILLKKHKNYKFYCFGELGARGDRKKFTNNLLKTIKKENLTNIEFLDFIPPQKIHLAYHYADIIIIPSKKEAFSMVALEALASKCLVISVTKGGLIEFLNDSNSILIDNYETFSKEAKQVILKLDENKKNELVKHGLETAKKFDWLNIAMNTEKIYDNLF